MMSRGVETLPDRDILAVILGSGECSDLKLAGNVLDCMTNLDEFERLSVKELEDIGIEETKALQIKAMFELSKRAEKAGMERTECIMSSQQLARRMMLDIGDKRQEHLVAIYFLNTQNRIIQQKTVFIGGVRRSIAEPREILHYACKLMATSLIVCHNHPSGETFPSFNDLDFTQKLKRSCDDLGICFIDHLIIGKGTYYSFREESEDFEI